MEITSDIKKEAEKLSKIDKSLLTNAKKFTFDGKVMACYCKKVYDGDTVHLVFRFSGEIYYQSCRLYGFNSAEIKSKDPEEKEKAIAARDFLKDLVLDKIIYAKFYPEDKYGRLLAELYTDEKTCVNSLMVQNGHGAEYFGKGEKKY